MRSAGARVVGTQPPLTALASAVPRAASACHRDDAKTVNVIVTAALSPKTKLSVPALQFFLSSDQLLAEEDEEDEDVRAERPPQRHRQGRVQLTRVACLRCARRWLTGQAGPDVDEARLALKVGRKTKKKQHRLEQAKRAIKRVRRRSGRHGHRIRTRHLHRIQSHAGRIAPTAQKEGRKKRNESIHFSALTLVNDAQGAPNQARRCSGSREP